MSGEFNLALAFMTGVFGAFHCFGMCSGMASGFFVHYSGERKFSPYLIYHSTRILIYTLLGAAGAAVGHVLVQVGIVGKLQGVMFILAGAIVMVIGLRLTGVFIKHEHKRPQPIRVPVKQLEVSFDVNIKRNIAPFIGGLLNGFVPCSLVFSVAIRAISNTNPVEAAMLMLAFGLGTWPAMLAISLLSAEAVKRVSGLGMKLAGLTVVILGAWTLYEGVVFFDVMRGLSSF